MGFLGNCFKYGVVKRERGGRMRETEREEKQGDRQREIERQRRDRETYLTSFKHMTS